MSDTQRLRSYFLRHQGRAIPSPKLRELCPCAMTQRLSELRRQLRSEGLEIVNSRVYNKKAKRIYSSYTLKKAA